MALTTRKNRRTEKTVEVQILRAVRVNTGDEGTRTLYPSKRGKTETLPADVAHLLISQNQARLAPAEAEKAEAEAAAITAIEEADALERIEAMEDVDVLRRWVEQEEAGEAREAVLEAINDRGAELYRRMKEGVNADGGEGEGGGEDADPLEGVTFASPEAEQEARDAGLTAEGFADVEASGKGGYTTADVRALVGDDEG